MCILAGMSVLAIVIIIVLALLLLLIVGGLAGARRRARLTDARLTERIAAADQALEAARAADRGWDPVLLEQAARVALERERPDFRYDKLHLVLVDDRPGTEADRAEMAAVGDEGVLRVSVMRHGDQWVAESVK
jgi:type II secretory pathway pseudopilin PulG